MNYTLDEENNLTMLEIGVSENEGGVSFTSPFTSHPYTLSGVSLAQFEEGINAIGTHELTSDLLNMVASVGGGKWNDDPSDTTTSYEYYSDTQTLCVTEG